MLADREDRERKELKRRDRDRAKLAYGDKFMPEDESDIPEETELSDWSAESEEEESEPDSPAVTDFQMTVGGDGNMHRPELSATHSRHKKLLSKCSNNDLDLAHRFNALRFLAMNLKSQNETMNK